MTDGSCEQCPIFTRVTENQRDCKEFTCDEETMMITELGTCEYCPSGKVASEDKTMCVEEPEGTPIWLIIIILVGVFAILTGVICWISKQNEDKTLH